MMSYSLIDSWYKYLIEFYCIGLRLQQLDLPYTHFIKSTMTRAQETGNIILQYLNGKSIPGMVDCSLLREGAPAPPEPAGSHKRPAVHVSIFII